MKTLATAIYRMWGAWLVLRGCALWVPCSIMGLDEIAQCIRREKADEPCTCFVRVEEREQQRMELN